MTKANQQIRAALLEGNWRHRRSVMSKIVEQFGNCERFEFEGEESFAYVQSQVLEVSCFGEKRLFIFREWPLHPGSKQSLIKDMISLVDQTPEDTLLIFDNLPKMTEKFLKHVDNNGKVLSDEQYIKPWHAPQWILKEFANREKQIEKQSADAIAEAIGADADGRSGVNIDKLHLTVEKICQHVGNRKRVTHDDVVDCCSHSAAFIIWNLFNLLDEKKLEDSVLLLNQAVEIEKNVVGLFAQIIGILVSRYSTLLFLKELLALCNNDPNAASEMSKKMIKLEKTGTGFTTTYAVGEKATPRFSEGAVRTNLKGVYGRKPAVQCYSRKDLVTIRHLAGQAREKWRVGCSDAELLMMLELLFGVVCGKVNANEAMIAMEITDGRYL